MYCSGADHKHYGSNMLLKDVACERMSKVEKFTFNDNVLGTVMAVFAYLTV